MWQQWGGDPRFHARYWDFAKSPYLLNSFYKLFKRRVWRSLNIEGIFMGNDHTTWLREIINLATKFFTVVIWYKMKTPAESLSEFLPCIKVSFRYKISFNYVMWLSFWNKNNKLFRIGCPRIQEYALRLRLHIYVASRTDFWAFTN